MSNIADQYTKIESMLSLADIDLSVSEVHGTVIGAIANHLKSGITPDLLSLIVPGDQSQESRYQPFKDALYQVYRDSTELLLNGQDGFELLLPDDDDALAVQIDGLAAWCRGYLLGLLYNNTFSLDQLTENGPEIIRDIMQISEAGSSDDANQTEDDWALAELQEYVKVGVQLVFEFIYTERASDTPPTRH